MHLIVGLGNPGREYAGTRHNMGFDTIDRLAGQYLVSVHGNAMKAEYGKGLIAGERVILMKPQTYMNLSGEAVQAYLHYYRLNPEEDLIVIYDDIDQDVGQLRIRKKGSAGGHNGMKNIIRMIGTDCFTRIRIGVGAKPEGWDLADYVLGHFPPEERRTVDGVIADAANAVCLILSEGPDAAMNRYNSHRGTTE